MQTDETINCYFKVVYILKMGNWREFRCSIATYKFVIGGIAIASARHVGHNKFECFIALHKLFIISTEYLSIDFDNHLPFAYTNLLWIWIGGFFELLLISLD